MRILCDTLLDLREVKAKSSIYLKVNKTRSQNVSLAIHFFGGTFPFLKEKWARIDDFAIFNPEILLDKFVVPENETVSELDDIIRVTHGDSEGQVLTAGSSRLETRHILDRQDFWLWAVKSGCEGFIIKTIDILLAELWE